MAKLRKKSARTRYYLWEGDACRVHQDESGSETADIYIAGEGLKSLSPTDVSFKGVQITRDSYERIVADEEARNRASAQPPSVIAC